MGVKEVFHFAFQNISFSNHATLVFVKFYVAGNAGKSQ